MLSRFFQCCKFARLAGLSVIIFFVYLEKYIYVGDVIGFYEIAGQKRMKHTSGVFCIITELFTSMMAAIHTTIYTDCFNSIQKIGGGTQ